MSAINTQTESVCIVQVLHHAITGDDNDDASFSAIVITIGKENCLSLPSDHRALPWPARRTLNIVVVVVIVFSSP